MVPGGVVNVLTGFTKELAPWLATHMDVNALDVTGVPDHLRAEVEAAATDNVKRIVRDGASDWFDGSAQSPYAVTDFMEMKTVWHPKGA